jgi:hypothetical protein
LLDLNDLKKIIVFIGLLTSTSFFGQTIRKYSNEFLNIGVDAAALGMSNAVTSQTSDVNSGYWNPAGLTEIKDHPVAFLRCLKIV